MPQNLTITAAERKHLRDLAGRYLEYAARPVMAERTELWYAHNELKGPRPMIVFESGSVIGEMMPPAKCTSPLAAAIEGQLQAAITEFDLIGDDKVISPYFRAAWDITCRDFDLDFGMRRGIDERGRQIGFAMEHPIKDLAADLPRLKHSVFSVDRAGSLARKAAIEDVLGDLMPVRIENWANIWLIMSSFKVVRLMGMEAMLTTMIDEPDAMKALYRFIADDLKAFILWQEKEGLLTANNANHYAGAGSYGFSRELKPVEGHVRAKDLWMNMNSQETVGISPAMFEEFVYPTYQELSEMFGLVYYGCCEPVHAIWDRAIGKLAHLRKVSISPWCDERAMGERLRTAPVIYSRKPRPNYIGVGKMDDAAFAEHAAATVQAAKGCHLEFIFRDIYSLDGDVTKPGRAVRIVREQIDKFW